MRTINASQVGDDRLPRPGWARPMGLFAILFGGLSLYSAGTVLFGRDEQRLAAGAVVPFVIWFNLLSAPIYVAAGLGLVFWQRWGAPLSLLVLAGLTVVMLAFLFHISAGGAFEFRTLAALLFRLAVWSVIAFFSCRALGCLKSRAV